MMPNKDEMQSKWCKAIGVSRATTCSRRALRNTQSFYNHFSLAALFRLTKMISNWIGLMKSLANVKNKKTKR